jgi:hypothetical protein
MEAMVTGNCMVASFVVDWSARLQVNSVGLFWKLSGEENSMA